MELTNSSLTWRLGTSLLWTISVTFRREEEVSISVDIFEFELTFGFG